ncbi:MAG: thiamine-phosphate kinase [Gammaproteobacteria bacterium]|nr:thiamine-phosphate kinase [Sideroxydans sp.]MBU3904201.1 thiamine-phosphate kinase [Gammaproteobacteria bacterium]MBU4045880.1 thiamine-phosphate kinase [Gammaproteobacteria bacterium]MBU4150274.1 thiamine-phosphate kinase [Gammaproteobacteria bacterium]
MSEFDLIRRYFTRPTPNTNLGVGDDAALMTVSPGMELAVSTDMLVGGTHFYLDTDPRQLGHKTLAVNLSDLAAMGAQPRWATLSLSLPQAHDDWLLAFSEGFFALADAHGVELVGGDTTRGPLNLSVTIMGEVPQGQALRRSGAQVGDDIWVSGVLGEAALGLAQLQDRVQLPEGARQTCLAALQQPQPRVELGLALRGLAHSAIDISDGLLADLKHILDSSDVAAEVRYDRLPKCAYFATSGAGMDMLAQDCVLSGGDGYELCFTAPLARRVEIMALADPLHLPLTRIGQIVSGQGCKLRAADGSVIRIEKEGYDHFA